MKKTPVYLKIPCSKANIQRQHLLANLRIDNLRIQVYRYCFSVDTMKRESARGKAAS
jgi:hypothetical protein